MKTLVLLAKGFEMMEFSVFIDVLGWARNDYGYDVQVETGGFQKQVVSTFHVPVTVDKLISEVNADDYEALAIPGGFEEYGFYEEAYDERFLNLIREFNSKNKIIASICVGALPLGKSRVLKNRKATTYHLRDGYRQKQLAEFSVNIVNEPIVVDENIITSYCPETAPEVAFKLLEMLTSKDQMEVVKQAMGFLVPGRKSEKAIITVLCMIYDVNKLLLQDRVKDDWRGVTFPGGHVERDESFVHAVIREMKEETGLTILDPKLCGVKQFRTDEGERYIVLLFRTDKFKGTLTSSEEGEMEWIDRDRLNDYPLVDDFMELLTVFDSEQYNEFMYERTNMSTDWLVRLY